MEACKISVAGTGMFSTPPYKRHFRSDFLVGDISMHFYRIKEANRQKAQIKPY